MKAMSPPKTDLSQIMVLADLSLTNEARFESAHRPKSDERPKHLFRPQLSKAMERNNHTYLKR